MLGLPDDLLEFARANSIKLPVGNRRKPEKAPKQLSDYRKKQKKRNKIAASSKRKNR